jgi:hypothetical protein
LRDIDTRPEVVAAKAAEVCDRQPLAGALPLANTGCLQLRDERGLVELRDGAST